MKKIRQKKNKGFTLIELLAVIVILAVIALIATPLVVQVINTSKKEAAENTGQSIIEAGKQKATSEDIKTSSPPFSYDENSGLSLNGSEPTKFHLVLNENMDSELRAWVNGFCVTKEFSDKTPSVDESKKTESDCLKITYKKYENGTAIYFNPETNRKCSSSEANSSTGTKSGCMKWYAFNDSESSNTVNVILDHNTTAKVAWNSSGSNSQMKEIKTVLTNDTSTWKSSLNPRLIEANEIAKITGNAGFDANVAGKDNWFYFETNKQNDPSIAQGKAKYKWLFNYTQGCTSWGCDVNDDSTMGYWTGSPILSIANNAWYVRYAGRLYYSEVKNNNYYGVRPVISIPKLALK